jgi:hypothetical protein
MVEITSLERKWIHVCKACWRLGNWECINGFMVHECGAKYTVKQWLQLPKVEIPAYRIRVDLNG